MSTARAARVKPVERTTIHPEIIVTAARARPITLPKLTFPTSADGSSTRVLDGYAKGISKIVPTQSFSHNLSEEILRLDEQVRKATEDIYRTFSRPSFIFD